MSEFNDMFDMMNRIFHESGPSYNSSKYIDFSCSEKQMDKDYIYYTFQTYELGREDIMVSATPITLDIKISKDPDAGFFTELPCVIHPKKTKVTLKNGILDIILAIDKKKSPEYIKVKE
jgi:HSP20 family molecular chaperone IbpA